MRSHAVGEMTVAVSGAFTGTAAVSWTAGTHPGYPRESSGVGWSGTTTLTQAPMRAVTRTRSPSRAWVSARPLRSRRASVVSCASQTRIAAGLRRAGWSTARGDEGLRQRVATETSTHAEWPTRGSARCGTGVVLVGPVVVGREVVVLDDIAVVREDVVVVGEWVEVVDALDPVVGTEATEPALDAGGTGAG